MKKNVLLQLGAMITMALLFTSCKKDLPCGCDDGPATMRVYATGLNNPRGLEFGPDGYLYVAEGGTGGTHSTVGQCQQVVEVGPYLGSPTGGRISRISSSGARTTLTDQLPSTQTSPQSGGSISGVGDIAFLNNTLYALLTAGGCSHGNPDIPNGVVTVATNGTWDLKANLSSWLMAHPAAQIDEEDFEPDGDWYSMISLGGDLYAIESNHGELVKITPNGDVSRIADISAQYGHIVPTALAYRDGNFYVGNLNVFPIQQGSSSVYRISMSGKAEVFATGFTTILGLAFDKKGRLYILENTTGNPFPTPGTGKIIRLDKDGTRKEVITGLSLPTGMTYGPDGNLYVSNMGFGPGAVGGGQVLQIKLNDGNCQDKEDYKDVVDK